ncbi:winged helix-turn-helix domain-containing protein [Serratia proteamaculans]|uniref:winged helix-turn-helix domain-containing protein n=1 Tax=Serratia proteamaculans TaxID=28151 RepID=UPI0014327B75|nr:winged helix-turn-helix domain-containing protein [Serratia proteamaculans]
MKNVNSFIINSRVFYDSEQRQLKPINVSGSATTLTVPASRCLILLLMKPREVVSQGEFFKHVWEQNGQYVTNNTLYQNISIIRKSLKIAGITEDIIVTVPKEGIKLMADVVASSPELNAEIDTPDENVVISSEPWLYGNLPGNEHHDKPPQETIKHDDAPHEGKQGPTNKNDNAAEVEFIPNTYVESPPKRSNRITYMLWITFFMALTTLTWGVLDRAHNRNHMLLKNYKQIGKVNHCQIFSQKNDIYRKNEGYLSFFSEMNINCNPNQSAYVTANATNTKLTIIICDSNPSDMSTCFSLFYTGLKDED